MQSPSVSVIIPSYNYAGFVSAAIESVLSQSFSNLELIVVDDGSTDHTASVVQAFSDPRVQYIHQENRGLPAARNTGIRASSGEFLAFLDADDRYHPRKLEIQVAFLTENPGVGLTYNSRFIVDAGGSCIQIQRAPASVDLSDLVSGYPFAPSDVLMRREWAFDVDLYDESFVANSEDLNFHIRLALAGCSFAGIPQVLSYRKIHANRTFRNIERKVATYLRALDTAFQDPRCPDEVLALRDRAYADHYLIWGYQAAAQQETELAARYLDKATRLNANLLADQAKPLLHYFVHASIRDGGPHEDTLRTALASLPPQYAPSLPVRDALVARGYLMRGLRDILWERIPAGKQALQKALQRQADLDEAILQRLSNQLSNYEAQFGESAAKDAWQRLQQHLAIFDSQRALRHVYATFTINQAFRNYEEQQYHKVPQKVLQAIASEPTYLANRGVLAMMVRSLIGVTR